MASQLPATAQEFNREDDVSTEDIEESAFLGRRCCCAWALPCYSSRKAKDWERISTSEYGGQNDGSGDRSWWSDGVDALKKVREWSELVAGPKWKTFIRRLNRAPTKAKSGKFQYDPFSYALNFDQGPGQTVNLRTTGFIGISHRGMRRSRRRIPC